MGSARIEFRHLHSVALPCIGDCSPGRLHTVLQDDDGNLYYSDEFNHSIVSLDKDGRIRWHKSGQGQSPGQFWYPRGMSLGYINDGNARCACIAVCDSWNHRMQIFDLDGNFKCLWDGAESVRFKEVVDVRFISEGTNAEEKPGNWLVLDSGNHRIVAMNLDAKFLFQIGRGFPPGLESHWPFFGQIQGFGTYDPLFYPGAILGKSEAAVFVYEAARRTLKQILGGNLFPLAVKPAESGDWIAADETGLLSWDGSTHRISFHDSGGERVFDIEVEAFPMRSNLRSREVWLQDGAHLEHWECSGFPVASQKKEQGITLLLKTAKGEIKNASQGEELGNAIESLLEITFELQGISERFCEFMDGSGERVNALKWLREQMAILWPRYMAAASSMRSLFQGLFLSSSILKLLASHCVDDVESATLVQADELWNRIAAPIRKRMEGLQEVWDALFALNLKLMGEIRENTQDRLQIKNGLDQQSEYIATASRELHTWSGAAARAQTGCDVFAKENIAKSPSKIGYPALWLRRPAMVGGSRSRYLREIDRIFLGKTEEQSPPGPYGLARASDGHLFVSLNWAGALVHLDRRGKVIERLTGSESENIRFNKPADIAFDDRERLWIANTGSHCIQIYDRKTNAYELSINADPEATPLNAPIGICNWINGSMLVADFKNHRLLALHNSQPWKTICSRHGRAIGELRYPIVVRRAVNDPGAFWVVDQLNHRIQEFDEAGNSMQSIGRGCLTMPEFMEWLSDDMVVVGQRRITRELKILSQEGKELDCMLVDYAPAGLLIHEGRLLVADLWGNHVRVYELI